MKASALSQELLGILNDLKDRTGNFSQEEYTIWTQESIKKVNNLFFSIDKESTIQTKPLWDKLYEEITNLEGKNNFPLQEDQVKHLKKNLSEVIETLNKEHEDKKDEKRRPTFKIKRLSLQSDSVHKKSSHDVAPSPRTAFKEQADVAPSPRTAFKEQAEAAPLTKNLINSNKEKANEDTEESFLKKSEKSKKSPTNANSVQSAPSSASRFGRIRSRSVTGPDHNEVSSPSVPLTEPNNTKSSKIPKRMFGLRKTVRDSRKHENGSSSSSSTAARRTSSDEVLTNKPEFGTPMVEHRKKDGATSVSRDSSPSIKSSKKSDDKKNRLSIAFTFSPLQKSDQSMLKTEDYTINIMKIIESFAPQEWQASSTERREKLKEEIGLQLLEFYSVNVPNSGRRKQKKGKLSSLQANFERNSPRSGICQVLHDTVQTFIQTILVFISGFDENMSNPTLKSPDARQTLSSLIISIAKSLSEMDLQFPSSFASDATLDVWKRVMGQLGDSLKGTVLPFKKSILHEGQIIKVIKKGLLESLLYQIESLYYMTGSMNTFYKDIQTDNQESRLSILSYFSTFKEALSSTFSLVHTIYSLAEEYVSTEPSSRVTKLEDEQPLWKDGEDQITQNFDQNDKYRPGTLNNLIIRITTFGYDPILVRTFITGYLGFCAPADLYYKLLQRYRKPSEPDMGQSPESVMKTTAAVVKDWCKNDYYSIGTNLILQIKKFAEMVLPKDNFSELSHAILKQISKSEKIRVREVKISKNIPIFSLDIQPQHLLKYADSLEIAEQMTLIDMEIYQRIKLNELTDLKWSKPDLKHSAPNVVAIMQRVNQISYWVATIILNQQKVVDRLKTLKKVISIAKCLFDLRNYNSLIGVLVGLNMSSISRLKHTFGGLSKRLQDDFMSLNLLQDPSGSFKNLRQELKLSKATVPYLGIHLSDLTMIDENAETINVGDKQLINLHKYHLVVNSIKDYLQFKKNPSEEINKQEPLYTLLYCLPCLGDLELWQLSSEREPRNSSVRDLD